MSDPKFMLSLDGADFKVAQCDQYRTGFTVDPALVVLNLRFPELGPKSQDMSFGFTPAMAEAMAKDLIEKAKMAREHNKGKS